MGGAVPAATLGGVVTLSVSIFAYFKSHKLRKL